MNIQDRLKRIKFFDVTPDLSQLGPQSLDALQQCVAAARITSDVYLEQVGPGNPEMYRQLRSRTDEEGRALARYFTFHGRPWDQFDKQPFVPGIGPCPKPYVGSYYPADLTKDEWERWLAAHPGDREAFESYYTLIKRTDEQHNIDGLYAVPYSVAYRPYIDRMRAHLRAAADELPGTALGRYLAERQAALASNDYYASELAWVDTDGSPFEFMFGPYEQYMDELLGLRAAFESYIGLPDVEMTEEVQAFLPVLHELNAELAQYHGFVPAGGTHRVIVANDVLRAGEAVHHGFTFQAFCLPNDRRVHEAKGSKRVISRTTLTAKYDSILLPIIERTLPEHLWQLISVRSRLLYVTAHEMAHGAGPTMLVRSDGSRVPFEVALGHAHSAVEETKADTLGAVLLWQLAQRRLIDGPTLAGCYFSAVADFARTWRLGLHEAHGRGAMVQYNWLKAYGGVAYDGERFSADTNHMYLGFKDLTDELIRIEQAGDPKRADAFLDRWSVVPKELEGVDRRFDDIPIDVYPEYKLPF